MNITKIIDEFLLNSEVLGYEYKLTIFHEYLYVMRSVNESNYFTVINGLRHNDVLDSVVYYINRKGRKKISFCSPVRVYFSAILEFLKYLNNQEKYPINNSLFDSQQKQEQLRLSVEVKMKELKLKESETDIHVSEKECDLLVKKCNEYIDLVSDAELIEGDAYNSSYTKFLSAIILKLVLFSGASKDTINNLMLSDYDCELNLININGYGVHLPDGLSIQLKKYIRIRKSILVVDSSKLFVKRNSRSSKKSNQSSAIDSSTMCAVLKEITGKNSIRTVSKNAIIEMIKKGIPQYLIMDFTGYKDEVYNYCLDVANEETSDTDKRFLDSKLRLINIFDKL